MTSVPSEGKRAILKDKFPEFGTGRKRLAARLEA